MLGGWMDADHAHITQLTLTGGAFIHMALDSYIIDEQYVRSVAEELSSQSFGHIQTTIRARLLGGRSLLTQEKNTIEHVVHDLRTKEAERLREADMMVEAATNVLLVTAYTSDYSIGVLCEKVNRIYASTYGYEFHSSVKSLEEVSKEISPKKHCTWYKIAVLRSLFNDAALLQKYQAKYVMWIDADAIFADHTVSLESVMQRAGGRDLIIAEDMNTGCLVNAGVFMLRTTNWSRQLLDDVWHCDRFDEVCFYEQSAMMRCLRARKEGLDSIKPFHSYLPGARTGIKLFPHTAVLPISEFNSNRGILCNDVTAFMSYAEALRSSCIGGSMNCQLGDTLGSSGGASSGNSETTVVRSACYALNGNYCSLCQRTAGSKWKQDKAAAHRAVASSSLFIFHPAGMPDKLLMLHTAIHKYGITGYDLAADILHDGEGCAGPAVPRSEEDTVDGFCTVKEEGCGTGGSGRSTPCDVVGTAPMRLVRGKMGQIPQSGQVHLLERLGKCGH